MLRPNLAVADTSMNHFLRRKSLPGKVIHQAVIIAVPGLLKRPSQIIRISAQAAQFDDAAIALPVWSSGRVKARRRGGTASPVVCRGVFHSKQICDGTSPKCFSQNAIQPYRLSLIYEQNIAMVFL
jgi:hypothetical protein